MDAAGVIAHYVMDGDRPLTAESNGNTTFSLYGLGGVGEKTTAWNFSLPDGTNTPRQLTDTQGDITLSARYTPWGDSLELHGTGNFSFGYLGGVLDATTGLLYVGNGQYYDPSTGRFLTRNVNPDNTNPYVPWNPIGAIVGPLGVIALVFGRKRKRGKWDTLIIIVLLGISAGVSLAACAPAPAPNVPAPGTNQPPASPAPNQTPVPTGPVTIPSDIPAASTPSPVATPTLPECPTPSWSPTPTPLSIDAELEVHGVKFDGDLVQWTLERKTAVLEAVRAVNKKLTATVVGAAFRAIYGYVNMTWGLKNATGMCASIAVGGCTSNRHQINFVTMSDDPLRARNNVVHELGHAFSNYWSNSLSDADREHPENTHPAIVLAWTQSFPGYAEYYINGFPNRPDPTDSRLGGFYGFASEQNRLTWQVAVANAGDPSEEFADQFLGWTFDTWELKADGTLSDFGILRRDWMDKYMTGWINRILRG